MTVLAVVALVGLVMILAERLWGRRRWPEVRGWWLRVALLNGLQVGAAWLGAATWEPRMVAVQPRFGEALGGAGGALVGYLTITFLYYWWHRARHASPWLWRHLHQLHHSASRLEVVTAFLKHPLEAISNGLITAAILTLLLGLSAEAAAGAIALCGLAELFYHWNVRTPRWLGYLIQRPESHCVHHERGRHASNYADLPVWDMLFGTFENPSTFEGDCGFEPEREARLWDMLALRDVHAEAP